MFKSFQTCVENFAGCPSEGAVPAGEQVWLPPQQCPQAVAESQGAGCECHGC